MEEKCNNLEKGIGDPAEEVDSASLHGLKKIFGFQKVLDGLGIEI